MTKATLILLVASAQSAKCLLLPFVGFRRRALLPVLSADLGEKYSNPVTGLLGKFLPRELQVDGGAVETFSLIDWNQPKKRNTPIDQLALYLEEGLIDREWFVSGMVLPEYFADDFVFQVCRVVAIEQNLNLGLPSC